LESITTGTAPMTFVAKTISGLEEVLAAEIVELGGANVQILTRAVSFEGDKRLLYKANYCLRTAQRILMPIFSFQMADEDDLYQQVNSYPWENYLSLTKTLAVDAVSTDSELTHTHYIALLTKDAIVDRFRTLNNGRRPSVDTENPHVRINMHINGSICDVSIDSSGASLHKRGYRVSNAEAPMSEVLAAGLILLTGWKRDCHFIDPMCGSGTLVIEAAMYANNFPAGMYRKEFGFMHWPDFDQQLWDEVTAEALDKQVEFDYQIIGSDISPKNLSSAKMNVKSARLHKDIKLHVSPFAAMLPPPGKPGLIIINPPYGERIRLHDIIGLYKSIGNTLKQEFPGYQAWVISSDQRALSFIGLRPSAKLPVYNGPLECRFEHFDLYRGSKRGRYMDGANQNEGNEENDHDSLKPKNKPDWRSKEAPVGDFGSPELNPGEFKPRAGRNEKRLQQRSNTQGENSGERPPRRTSNETRSDLSTREFSPREHKTREEKNRGSFIPPEKQGESKDFRKNEKTARSDRFAKGNPNDRPKAEKQFIRPATRIEEREVYLQPKISIPESPGVIPEGAPAAQIKEQAAENQRIPSKGNKFTEKRDSKLTAKKELRPRMAKAMKNINEPQKSKTGGKGTQPPVNYDDLED